LQEAGDLLAVVSNQRGVARGIVKPQVLKDIEGRIRRDLIPHGCAIGAFRYCTHDEKDACECRKPKPGMLLDLARELGIDLETSWMIGDSESDIRAGKAAGCRTALVGYPTLGVEPDVVGPSLAEVSDLIVHSSRM
jgi:D-glycero-D-manno-heptose 1,7-bisphosphate phosphatase